MDWLTTKLSAGVRDDHPQRTRIVAGLRRSKSWLGCVGFLLAVEAATGLLLMTVYSPSTATAWGSVWYVQTQLPGGWFIRGLHHFASDAMIVVLVAALVHLLVTRSYGGASAVGWWAALLSTALVVAIALSGVLLPWDQHGYWGTTVRSNILARTPLLGPALRTLLWGGAEMGDLTLARFFALHAFVFSGALACLLVFHRSILARVSVLRDSAGDRLRSALYRALIFGVAAGAAWFVCRHHGSTWLGAPADPRAADYPARPEWHALFLYQWLKYFEGATAEVVGAIVIPGAVVAALFLLPIAARFAPKQTVHRAAVGGCAALGVAILALSGLELLADRNPGDGVIEAIRAKHRRGDMLSATDHAALRAREFNHKRVWASRTARRAVELAEKHGIPPTGALSLLAADPVTRGPVLFSANCADCHRFGGQDGTVNVPLDAPTSSDLKGFAGREWIRGLLADPMSERYFGRMRTPDGAPAHTRMSKWLSETREGMESDEARSAFETGLDAAAAYLEFESDHPGRFVNAADASNALKDMPEGERSIILRGREFFASTCNECHSYGGSRSGTIMAPEMLGYASVEWMALMIAEPDHEERYRTTGREHARMPRFADRLSDAERRLIAKWIRESRGTAMENEK
jgi:ubiquinol-cytochrome c reductase cytochrome b subunit